MEDNEVLQDEELSNIITLTDENGEDADFEFMDLLEYQGDEYVVLLPMDENNSEIVILKVVPIDDENESYVSADDETVSAVYEIFKEKYKDILTFED